MAFSGSFHLRAGSSFVSLSETHPALRSTPAVSTLAELPGRQSGVSIQGQKLEFSRDKAERAILCCPWVSDRLLTLQTLAMDQRGESSSHLLERLVNGVFLSRAFWTCSDNSGSCMSHCYTESQALHRLFQSQGAGLFLLSRIRKLKFRDFSH